MVSRSLRRLAAAVGFTAALGSVGCGYSEEEWQAQLSKYNMLLGDHQTTQSKLASVTAELEAERAKVADLGKRLQAMGVDIQAKDSQVSKLASTLEEREKALAEYKARAKQLEAIRARFETLRKKLDQLTKLGIAVTVRKNRMVISLPGDVLFDSGRETLRKEGKEILASVAKVVREDAGLKQRDYQVAGHTDNKPLGGGPFKDNWGLSVMRAREVLVYLVSPKDGQLPAEHWSASGYADMDPVATNDTDEGRQKNRRVDLVVVPSVEEMLDLKAIAN